MYSIAASSISRRLAQRGSSLIEALLAIGLVSIWVALFATIVTSAIRGQVHGKNVIQASFIADSLAEQLMSLNAVYQPVAVAAPAGAPFNGSWGYLVYDELGNEITYSAPPFATLATLPTNGKFLATWTVSPNQPIVGMKTILLKIEWQEDLKPGILTMRMAR